MLRRILQWLSLASEPDIIIGQYRELRRQVPLLYAQLILNASAVSYTHYDSAPKWLTVGVTGVLIAVSAWRLCSWLFADDVSDITVDRARLLLRRTTLSAAPICIGFVSWALLLNRYGGPFESAHIALFIAVTVIGCIFCLMHLPQAALLVTVVVTVPYVIYYLMQGNPVFVAMALNIALVTAVMVRVLLNSFAGFTTLIQSQVSLAAERAEAQRLGAENAVLALTDALTGLPNRRHFLAKLEALLKEREGSGERFAVGILDLDRFKPVNDTYGHILGDRVLKAVAARLAEACSGSLSIARLGGDEFGILITEGVDETLATGQRLCDMLATPFAIDGHRITLGCSGGFATFPEAGATAHELFDRSDYALYHAKSAQRGACVLFSVEHETLIRSESLVEAALQSADFDAELHVEFQPILCTETLEVQGVEALGRWTSPILGVVAPDRFILTAERVGVIHTITACLLGKALSDFATMPETLGLSFNLSAQDIVSPPTLDLLLAEIAERRIDPKRITFELTETALMRDFDAAVRGIVRLRSLGIQIALDDFGTGYSSLGHLHRLPLDKVKVDRSFIADIDEVAGRNIISAILGLCNTLGLECIIEGVETDAQLQQLRGIGYRRAQGFLFARPMRSRALLTWLERQWMGNLQIIKARTATLKGAPTRRKAS